MSKCPFWSTKVERVSCYSECPMYSISKSDEVCPFTEYLSGNKIVFKDIIEEDFAYSKEKYYDLSYVGANNYQ